MLWPSRPSEVALRLHAHQPDESLSEQVLVIENRLRLVGNRTALLPGRMEASITEHEKLLAAIARGDAALAERLNRERIQHIRDAFAQSTAFSCL